LLLSVGNLFQYLFQFPVALDQLSCSFSRSAVRLRAPVDPAFPRSRSRLAMRLPQEIQTAEFHKQTPSVSLPI
jgi:hypothetical protein